MKRTVIRFLDFLFRKLREIARNRFAKIKRFFKGANSKKYYLGDDAANGICVNGRVIVLSLLSFGYVLLLSTM